MIWRAAQALGEKHGFMNSRYYSDAQLRDDTAGDWTPCCDHSPFELPRTDRITEDPALVTCKGKAAQIDREQP